MGELKMTTLHIFANSWPPSSVSIAKTHQKWTPWPVASFFTVGRPKPSSEARLRQRWGDVVSAVCRALKEGLEFCVYIWKNIDFFSENSKNRIPPKPCRSVHLCRQWAVALEFGTRVGVWTTANQRSWNRLFIWNIPIGHSDLNAPLLVGKCCQTCD